MKQGDISKQEWMGMRELVSALDQWWKSQPKDGIKKGGDAMSITSAAQDAAFIGECNSVEQMLKNINGEIERLRRLRFAQKITPKGHGGPKIRLSLKQTGTLSPIQSEASLVSAPSTSEASNLPKPKLKLRLGNLSTALKVADRNDDKAKSVEKDGFEDLAFNIVVRPNPKTTMQSSIMAKRKKDSDLNPYRGGVQDNDDEEWVPGGSASSRKRSSAPAVTQVVSSLMPVTSSLKHQNNLTTKGKALNSTASKRAVASSRPPATTAPAKTKPKASARDRLKKRLRF
jgi:hypothetical protein